MTTGDATANYTLATDYCRQASGVLYGTAAAQASEIRGDGCERAKTHGQLHNEERPPVLSHCLSLPLTTFHYL